MILKSYYGQKQGTQVKCQWMHQRNTGKIQLHSLPEGWAALLRATCQSIWLAKKKDVFNPSCGWLQCCWFHQICIVLSIQGWTLQNRSIKSHCCLAHLLWMELFVRNSLCGFNLCRFSVVRGNVVLYPASSSVKPKKGAGRLELADVWSWRKDE